MGNLFPHKYVLSRCHVPTDQISDPILDFKQTVVVEGLIVSIKITYWSLSVSRIFHSFSPLAEDIVYVFCSSFSSITWYAYWQPSCINTYFATVGDDRI